MDSIIFTELCNHHHNLNLEYFHHTQINSVHIRSHFSFCRTTQPLATINLLYIFISFWDTKLVLYHPPKGYHLVLLLLLILL